MKAISVTQLNNQIKSVLESHFQIVLVEGEVSKAVYHSSGHLYFVIKDENSSVSCAMWRSNLSKMKFKLKEGEKVLVYGAVSLYMPRGEYKLIAQNITPSGVGALQKAYEQLKEELNNLGYFDKNKKKPIPRFPKRIAIVTSATAAALQDMLKVANKRWKLTKFYLFNALVQGEEAGEDIARKIKMADEFRFENGDKFDLIIVGRGGGSKEDLWAFNQRVVADAIFKAKTPVISAVGHEIDYLISDFVADKRAATPSNAMEIALPDSNEILIMIDEMINSFNYKFKNILYRKEKNLKHLIEVFEANSIDKKLNMKLENIEIIKNKFYNQIKFLFNIKTNKIEILKNEFNVISPKNRLEKIKKEIEMLNMQFQNSMRNKFFVKENEIKSLKNAFEMLNPKKRENIELIKNNKKIKLSDLKIDDIFEIINANRKIKSKVLEITAQN